MSALAAASMPVARRSVGGTIRARPIVADGSHDSVASPARQAQLDLAARLAEPPAEARWSARRAVALTVGGSAMLWAAIAIASWSIIH